MIREWHSQHNVNHKLVLSQGVAAEGAKYIFVLGTHVMLYMSSTKRFTPSIAVASILSVPMVVLFFILGNDDNIESIRWLGWAVLILSAYLGWAPMFIFKKKGGVAEGDSFIETTKLVTGGLYSVIRHPQYLGWALLLLGMLLINQHWILIAIGVPAILLIYVFLGQADKELVKKFGEPYEAYMKRVPRTNFLLGLYRLARGDKR